MFIRWLLPVILCCIFSCHFIPQDMNQDLPYPNAQHLTGQMLYARGDYFYHKAKSHSYGGLPETDMDEMEQAGRYYGRALAAGYRPEAGYAHLNEYYYGVGDYKKREAGLTALIEAYPQNPQYWYNRMVTRQTQKNYHGALQDINEVLRPDRHFTDLEYAYYLRGAFKYMLNPTDTASAEADRSKAQQLHKGPEVLIPYHHFCSSW